MKHLIITIILLAAAIGITVVYFENLESSGGRPEEVMNHIPDDASVIAEFDNETSFYELFSGNNLLTGLAGKSKTDEFKILREQLLLNPGLAQYFDDKPIYISLHPQSGNQLDYLLTTSVDGESKLSIIQLISNNLKAGIENIGNGIYEFNAAGLTRPFYLTEDKKRIISGSFSKDLIAQAAAYDHKKHLNSLKLSDQQRSNAIAILYINYSQLPQLCEQLFVAKNPDMLRPFRLMPAHAALSLNYKKDALMFNGLTNIDKTQPISYLNLFAEQQPIINHLKDLMPATTAYSTTFSVSNPKQFVGNLTAWQDKSIKNERESLYNKIKSETGVNINREFHKLLGNEFSIITTRFQEKLAIIEVSNGQQLRPFMTNISNMVSDDVGQFNYNKLPFFLLGDAFSLFNKPYFIIINNYLVLANSAAEVRSYYETYTNQKFLSRTQNYNEFDGLLSERSNVAFFINFKNAKQVFKRDLKPEFYNAYQSSEPGFKDYYGASYQLISSDHHYYTNFCMKLAATDSITTAQN
ncbi:hypothetical protein [Mucilaginibacter sp. KACC 22063]|uniref:hypothetical protein n=1 Tax=Mucilaginibacter sp. KACC 22063 TaxID=3025666 RepID=UPI002365EEDD|nr:hypothetical protein [Mucilaginibacter sp. KACC 22063]WDF54153.1 hypothetical protein PQ461_14500 [Mucilaginibacter sp. KACC 22063]